ncbi:hypothetical protein BEWA_035660 [Theileria equi strain WA]|uniref:Signal peptide-containing protein n=1 Tax=Theileria equi strain WA TaxID=1537102 RepID=L1LE54_THEEQ|nr:hypothetical protein BEWA_035660 [Theileria equi strain WA]EKX73530.1 hypothetical protein BEWA_035660 [Theileria equi strain WA]|eukprot:XP_004832982.1 hypothetical protein BEWA_035660 [Theileria equi strain WA]
MFALKVAMIILACYCEKLPLTVNISGYPGPPNFHVEEHRIGGADYKIIVPQQGTYIQRVIDEYQTIWTRTNAECAKVVILTLPHSRVLYLRILEGTNDLIYTFVMVNNKWEHAKENPTRTGIFEYAITFLQ